MFIVSFLVLDLHVPNLKWKEMLPAQAQPLKLLSAVLVYLGYPGVSVQSLFVLPVPAWVLSEYSGFLPHLKYIETGA